MNNFKLLRANTLSILRGNCFRYNSTNNTIRTLYTSPILRSPSNVFSEVTKLVDNKDSALSQRMEDVRLDNDDEKEIDISKITIHNDESFQKYIKSLYPEPTAAPKLYLSALKYRIYKENCKQNRGIYNPLTEVKLPDSPYRYKLNLTKEEIDALEPSVYMKSTRIKSSMKKATVLLRMLRGLDARAALTQCHFSDKLIARDVAKLLEKGIQHGKDLGLKADDLYIAQIWVGSDGKWVKRLDYKGRGRTGIIHHPYVHIRGILKTKSITKQRLQIEKKLKQQKSKPWVQLRDAPIRGEIPGVYMW
ncbi:hypothetical protein TBLA_0B09690 [Henningerozyma blattae CBS 6284]|uniref:Ribosomal protein L22 n=1 Tax=Henningerozyma blattae (strain ATCC 34711 / CBS 6284 / DSM 70876 / NBRC 10599 / NRRL Y-10934 / UCD 77-7) TaxID=1071380 RepID=I2H083_HENB6|nr:hypothetical protein TBLA_0B09690 [Tetrapisispora blattae CBS 6284]CCH59785.1 hypothetical protein TBLA_0B09690 [Tetrapisispora blattae CBS 6284]